MAASNPTSSFQRKLALIIGNNNYCLPSNRLKTAENNARDLSDSLRKIDFDVTTACNLSKRQMVDRVIDFAKTIRNNDLIFFYFCGHGYQANGDNYLIPIDDSYIKNNDDLEDFAVNFQLVLTRLSKMHSSAAIFVVDYYPPYTLANDSSPNRK